METAFSSVKENPPFPSYPRLKEPTRQSPILLPAELYVSAKGASALSSAGVKTVKLFDGSGAPREGFSAGGFNGSTIRNLIMKSLVDEIRVSLPELLSRRKHILSLNGLILYTVLYRKLNPVLAQRLLSSETVKEFNRKNPRISIVSLEHIDRSRVHGLRESLSEEFRKMETDLKTSIIEKIESDPEAGPEDRKSHIRSIDRFLEFIDERIWYLYFVINRTASGEKFRNTFAREIRRFLSHTVLADHFGNLLMEFIQNAEKAHFERIIQLYSLCPLSASDEFLRHRSNRKRIISLAERTGDMLDLSWIISRDRAGISSQFRMAAAVSNLGIISEGKRNLIQRKMQASAEGMALSDFYKFNDDIHLGAGLGLHYNSYMEDFCRRNGIWYRASVFQEPGKERTTVKAELIF